MKDFLFFNNWFEQEFESQAGVRYITFKTALNLLLQNRGKIIVETGTMRKLDLLGDGGSTLLFGKFGQKYGTRLYTVDISKKNISLAKKLTRGLEDNITYVVSNSIKFLKNFNRKINLLYLDSLDCPVEGDATEAQIHQLNELKAAWGKLASNAVILLDDNKFQNGGKTRLSKEFLFRNGCLLLIDSYQSLWIKRGMLVRLIWKLSALKKEWIKAYILPPLYLTKKGVRVLLREGPRAFTRKLLSYFRLEGWFPTPFREVIEDFLRSNNA